MKNATFANVLFLLMLFILSFEDAGAWSGSAAGRIQAVEITAGSNFGFRVILAGPGVAQYCGSGNGWGYLNESDSNYKVYVSSLLAAKATMSTVTLWMDNIGGFCRIGHMRVD